MEAKDVVKVVHAEFGEEPFKMKSMSDEAKRFLVSERNLGPDPSKQRINVNAAKVLVEAKDKVVEVGGRSLKLASSVPSESGRPARVWQLVKA